MYQVNYNFIHVSKYQGLSLSQIFTCGKNTGYHLGFMNQTSHPIVQSLRTSPLGLIRNIRYETHFLIVGDSFLSYIGGNFQDSRSFWTSLGCHWEYSGQFRQTSWGYLNVKTTITFNIFVLQSVDVTTIFGLTFGGSLLANAVLDALSLLISGKLDDWRLVSIR